jgi:hypothetical protein
VNFQPLRKLTARLAALPGVALLSIVLGSCGGGGATHETATQTLTIMPSAATLYAGVAYTFQIAGGVKPYLLSSSEPVLLPVPSTLNANTFSVVPNNPSVVDAGLPPGALPIRTVVITVRDSAGTVITTPSSNGISVAQNFLTGYGITFTSNCLAGQACSGSDSIVRLVATTNGLILRNRAVRFCVIRGNFRFVVPESPSNPNQQQLDCYDTTTDEQGVAIARIRVPSDAVTQLGTIRITDLATGAYQDQVFTITQGNISGALTIIPNQFTFTGPRQGVCGTGSGDFVVFDGDPPYTAVSSSPNVTVSPTTNSSNPARFTVTAFNPNACVTNVSVVVTDRNQRRGTVTVTTVEGTAQQPALVVAPTSVDLGNACNFSSSVTVAGGVGPISTNSSHPRVVATVSGNTVTITRLSPDPASPPNPAAYPTTGTVSITDGATIQTVDVNNIRAFCP